MNIEDLKARQHEKYFRAFALVSIDVHTTLALVQELRESANAIETLQRELEEARKDGARLSYVLENGRPDIIVNDNDECGYGYYSITGKGEMVRWHATKIEAIDYARTPPPNPPTTKPDAT